MSNLLAHIQALWFRARLVVQRLAFQLYISRRKQRLAGADLSFLSFRGLNLRGANMRGANLARSDLSRADLRQADLEGTDLSYADLSHADLRDANLRRATLRFADLSAANLAGADLEGANLDRAPLFGADLSGATLAGAWATSEQLAKAGSLRGAILPDGTICTSGPQQGRGESKLNTQTSVDSLDRAAETRRGVTRWLIKEPAGVVMVAVILFVSAGRWDWGWGWALVAIYAAWVAATTLLLIRRNPELLAERAARRKDQKGWDTTLMSVVGLLTMAAQILAGLDVRWNWSDMPVTLHVAGLVVATLSQALVVWATVANAFFSKIVRIQQDRNQTVVSGGPYRYVRHPAYVGTVAFNLSTPLLLGSWWALIPGALVALLMVIRTALEDRTLQTELPGYPEYSQKTRYRLLPGIW